MFEAALLKLYLALLPAHAAENLHEILWGEFDVRSLLGHVLARIADLEFAVVGCFEYAACDESL